LKANSRNAASATSKYYAITRPVKRDVWCGVKSCTSCAPTSHCFQVRFKSMHLISCTVHMFCRLEADTNDQQRQVIHLDLQGL
jgi:hypothetical protein